MTIRQTIIAVGVGLLVSAASPALAGDWNNGAGSLKDPGGPVGIPVPVPAPVPEIFNWYLRVDGAFGWQGSNAPRESGLVFGRDRALIEGGEFGTDVFRHIESDETQFMFGGGFGYYFNPRFRGDLTFEVRRDQDTSIRGNYNYTRVDDQQNPIGRVVGHSLDETSLRSWVTMANLYWDLLPRGSRFVPYVGAGLGLAVNRVERTHFTEEEVRTNCGACSSRTYDGADNSVHYSLAASAMAGLTYTINPQYALDLSYRYMFIGGFDATMPVVASSDDRVMRSTLHFGDQHEHQIRAGLRVNVF